MGICYRDIGVNWKMKKDKKQNKVALVYNLKYRSKSP